MIPFSVVDVVETLTESTNPRDYWFKMKQRVKIEDGIEEAVLKVNSLSEEVVN